MVKKVTDRGVLIPKEFFPGIEEVEIRRQNGAIVVTPKQSDPIFDFGKDPLPDEITDASENLDRYIY
jgi:hypothetical protein